MARDYRAVKIADLGRARTIEQMRLINALCRLAEIAGELAG